MKLIDLIPLQEIDFASQKAFDAYSKNHKLRPTTKVKIAGKTTTAGQASKVKGTSVFGDGDKEKSKDSVDPKTKKELDSIHKQMLAAQSKLKSFRKTYKDNYSKASKEKQKKMDADLKAAEKEFDKVVTPLEAQYKKLEKKSTSVFDARKDKSITDIKVDKQVDVSMVSKSILPNLKLADGIGTPQKDAVALKKRLDNGDGGVYTRTSPHGGNIVFKDGTKFEVFKPYDAHKTKSTQIYASKS
jgi:hypothetical protein